MNKNLKFSIIVPIYKVEKYIDRCIKSILYQTYENIEIILVDDGSPDNCPQICDDYAKKDNRIKVVHKKNGGLSDARNKGLEVATGEYIIFVDSDDYIEKNTCERFQKYAEKGYDVLIGDALVEGGVCDLTQMHFDGVLDGKTYLKNSLKQKKGAVVAWINSYNRKFLLNNNLKFKYGRLHEDVEFTPRMFLKAKSVCYTGIEFYHYIIREDSITTKKDKRKNLSDLYKTCEELERIYLEISDRDLQEILRDSLVCSYLNLFQEARAYRYGREYIHKDFCIRNSFKNKTKYKSFLFNISPRLYWNINNISKKIK